MARRVDGVGLILSSGRCLDCIFIDYIVPGNSSGLAEDLEDCWSFAIVMVTCFFSFLENKLLVSIEFNQI